LSFIARMSPVLPSGIRSALQPSLMKAFAINHLSFVAAESRLPLQRRTSVQLEHPRRNFFVRNPEISQVREEISVLRMKRTDAEPHTGQLQARHRDSLCTCPGLARHYDDTDDKVCSTHEKLEFVGGLLDHERLGNFVCSPPFPRNIHDDRCAARCACVGSSERANRSLLRHETTRGQPLPGALRDIGKNHWSVV
jgi:hypothetical protein